MQNRADYLSDFYIEECGEKTIEKYIYNMHNFLLVS